MKIEEEIRWVLENYSEPIATRTAIYGEKKFSHLAIEVLTRELTELFRSYCCEKEDLPDEEEIFVILENLQAEGKGIYEFAKAIAKRIGKEKK